MRYDPVYQRLVVPIRPHVEAELFVPALMTEADWSQFMTVLAAMKPGLVREEVVAAAEGLTAVVEANARILAARDTASIQTRQS